jgi:hypothetical protein
VVNWEARIQGERNSIINTFSILLIYMYYFFISKPILKAKRKEGSREKRLKENRNSPYSSTNE